MVFINKQNFTLFSVKVITISSIFILLVGFFLVLASCASRSMNLSRDLKKILAEEEFPKDPAISDELICMAAADYAKQNGYNPPVLLYTDPEGNIKAKPGGKIGIKNTPDGAAMVMLMVNTSAKPIPTMNKLLNKGEIAIYRVVGNSAVIDIPGVVLKPSQ